VHGAAPQHGCMDDGHLANRNDMRVSGSDSYALLFLLTQYLKALLTYLLLGAEGCESHSGLHEQSADGVQGQVRHAATQRRTKRRHDEEDERRDCGTSRLLYTHVQHDSWTGRIPGGRRVARCASSHRQ